MKLSKVENLEYRLLCQKIVESDHNINYAFIVNSTAKLVALAGGESVPTISEDRFAELMEDLLFMVTSRRHYEDLHGAVQFVHIRHTRSDTFVLPFERDNLLCVCIGSSECNEEEFLRRLQKNLLEIYQYARHSNTSKAKYDFSMPK